MATIRPVEAGGKFNTTTTWIGGVVPTAADDVVVPAGTGPLEFDTAICKLRSFVCEPGHTGEIRINSTVVVGTSTEPPEAIAFKLAPGTKWVVVGSTSGTRTISFESTSTAWLKAAFSGHDLGLTNIGINKAKCEFTENVKFTSFTLISGGGLSFGPATITVKSFDYGVNPLEINTATGVLQFEETFNYRGTGAITWTGTGLIEAYAPGPQNIINFKPNGQTLGRVTLTGGAWIQSNLTCTTLSFQIRTAQVNEFWISSGIKVACENLISGGSTYELIKLESKAGTEPAIIEKLGDKVVLEWFELHNIAFTGGANWFASNCANHLLNTGITFLNELETVEFKIKPGQPESTLIMSKDPLGHQLEQTFYEGGIYSTSSPALISLLRSESLKFLLA